jgi:hypothetical protein
MFYILLLPAQLRKCEGTENESSLVWELLLPLARGLTPNWSHGNRLEAGAALAHIVGSGVDAKNMVGSMSRIFKKVSFRWLIARGKDFRT